MSNSVEKLSLILDCVPEAITVTDLYGTITECNEGKARIHGLSSKSHVLGKSALDFVAPDDRERARANAKKTLNEGSVSGIECALLRADGTTFPGELSVSLLRNAAGSPTGFIAVTRDVTERRRVEEQLKSSRGYLEKLNDSLEDVILTVTYPERVIQYVNRSVKRVFGYEVEECIGRNTEFLFASAEEYQSFGDKLREAVEEEANSLHAEVFKKRKNGEVFPAEITITFLEDGGKLTQDIGVLRDITERRRAEEELKKSRRELRSLYAHAQSLREEVRATIAREIHDELGQALTALSMDLSWLRKNLPRRQDSLVEKTEAMAKMVSSTIQTMRKISSDLRPPILDDFGLLAAVEWYAGDFQKRSGIEVRVVSNPEDIVLEKEQSIAIYRIFQVALTNIAQHANATRVVVELNKENGRFAMRIADNGKGIMQEEISSPKSFGIMGMRERALFLGGDFRIRGTRGKGTEVTVSIPVDKEELDD